ncbi:hypothetical protein HELRODRAFT_167987 [Helobdella robusta]|uniref:Uncharacterized protein n=1 Tax=Helobdella robusta TaxID=6412 RepID=T1F015_HELRO|nr:hypothetical protein HELRODRAFT_167987 [Helobdella robusta]ESO10128.1 hypothetical protein HELRODRAFT_167987 [Helobdella robusta]
MEQHVIMILGGMHFLKCIRVEAQHHISTSTQRHIRTPTQHHIRTPTQHNIRTPTQHNISTPTQHHISTPTQHHTNRISPKTNADKKSQDSFSRTNSPIHTLAYENLADRSGSTIFQLLPLNMAEDFMDITRVVQIVSFSVEDVDDVL